MSSEPQVSALKRAIRILPWLPLFAIGALLIVPIALFWLFVWVAIYACVIIKALRGDTPRMFECDCTHDHT